MTTSDFDNYLNIAVLDYADDKIKAGTWKETEAIKQAKKSFTDILPEGINTADNYLFSIYIPTVIEPIGMVWMKITNRKAFIYDFKIHEEFRGKGYGKQTLKLFEKWACEHHLTEIGLHVFAHNTSAYQLYKKMGYDETDITMVRKIK